MSDSGENDKSDRLDYWIQSWEQHDIRFHQPLVNKLANEGYTVVGADIVKIGLEEFYTDHGLDWTEKAAPNMGPDCKVLECREGNIRLYLGDIMLFNQSVEGQFDMVWDRAALVAINRDEIQRYIRVMKDILCPGGRMIFESLEYDVSIFEGVPNTPPPHPMYEAEIKSLFGPDFTVEFLEKNDFNLRRKDVYVTYYLITKKT